MGTGLTNGKRKRRTALILELIEMGIAFILVYFFWQYGHSEVNLNAWIGAGISLIPDFLEAPRNFVQREPKIIQPLNALHGAFHHSTPNMIFGLAPQLAIASAIFLMR